jgi:hypothetical protein
LLFLLLLLLLVVHVLPQPVLFSPVPANLPAKGAVPAETTTIADPMRIEISQMFESTDTGNIISK